MFPKIYARYYILYSISSIVSHHSTLFVGFFLVQGKSENIIGCGKDWQPIAQLPISKNNPHTFKAERKPFAALKLTVYSESLGGIESI